MIAGRDDTIKVVWQCGMGKHCINKDRPGTHTEYADAQKCVRQGEPRGLKRQHQH